MKAFNIITGLVHILGALVILVIFAILTLDEAVREITGTNIYKDAAAIVGGLLMLAGGIFVIKRRWIGILLLVVSLLTYVIGASYEIVLEHGVLFYENIMVDYFYSAGVRALGVVLAALSLFMIRRANKSLKKTDRAGRADS